MALVLSWFVLGLGLIALAYPLAQTVRTPVADGPRSRVFFLATVVILVLGALLTLPGQPPWSAGQTLGPGFLMGGGAVLLSALAARAMPAVENHAAGDRWRWMMSAERIAAPVVAVGVVLVLYPRHVMDPLAGLALGAVTAGVILGGGLGMLSSGTEQPAAARTERSHAADLTATTAVALAAATYLAAFHLAPNAERSWQPLPGLLAGVLALAFTARGLLGGARVPSNLLTLLVVAVPVAITAAIVAFRLDGTRGFFVSAVVGLGVFALIAWLDRAPANPSAASPGAAELIPFEVGLLAGLLVLGGSIVAFRELHGFGIGVMTLAGLAFLNHRNSPLVRGGIAVGVLLTLFRVYLEHRGLGERWEPDFHYYLVALLAGASLPLFLSGSVARWVPGTPGKGDATWALVAALLSGGAAALLPLILWLGVGDRPQTALAVGLVLSPALLLARGGSRESRAGDGMSHLLAFGALLSASQLTFLIEPFSQSLNTRPERVWLFVVLGVFALGRLGLTELRRARSVS